MKKKIKDKTKTERSADYVRQTLIMHTCILVDGNLGRWMEECMDGSIKPTTNNTSTPPSTYQSTNPSTRLPAHSSIPRSSIHLQKHPFTNQSIHPPINHPLINLSTHISHPSDKSLLPTNPSLYPLIHPSIISI